MPLAPASEQKLKQFFRLGLEQGCPKDQMLNFCQAGIILQARQLAASAAARLCDQPDGPIAIGYGGARGGGKTHWLLAQIGADDCQRVPGLKCLLLRKVGKANLENFESLRQRLFPMLPHSFAASRGLLVFPNESRITLGHYQCEKEIDSYLGLEYDVIGIEEATQLTPRKYEDISTCCRTSKPNWRPRIYSTTNPGGIGHQWYLEKFITPRQCGTETTTRFISARVEDNAFINPDYKASLSSRTGWQYEAWYLGRWDFPAGQFFKNFRPEFHIVEDLRSSRREETHSVSRENNSKASVAPGFNEPASLAASESPRFKQFSEGCAVEWFASMDYGYTHRNVVLLGCRDDANNIYVVDEHAERYWIPQRNAQAVKAMFARHNIYSTQEHLRESLRARFPDQSGPSEFEWRHLQRRMLKRFVAGSDMFGSESTGESVAKQYRELGLRLTPANMDRVYGWSVILDRLGDPAAGIKPTLFIHKRCRHLIECLPYIQHDPDRPGDILKTNVDEEGSGGDDAADALRYLLASRTYEVHVVPLLGL